MPGWMEQAIERTFDDLRNCRITNEDALRCLWAITHGFDIYRDARPELEVLSA